MAGRFDGAGSSPSGLFGLASEVLTQVRRAKSERKLSMRTEVALATVTGPPSTVEAFALVEADLRAAGHITKLDLHPDEAVPQLTLTCTF